ncbi:hypothetical protein CLOM_g14097 [Closterium sp. NIES-68]|nr:hypothetical protein CLOM_g14097 [Closterium sp. NIES-68]
MNERGGDANGRGAVLEKTSEPPPSKVEALDGSNYEEWSGRMRSAFKRYKLLKIAVGEEKMPEEGEARERWIEKSAVLFDLILQSVNEEMFEHIKDLVEADDSGPRAWKLLRDLPIIPWNGKTPTAATAVAAKATAGGDATAPTDGVLEAVKKVQQQQTHGERECGHKVKVIRSDNGGEFIGADFEGELKRKGIQHQLTVPYNPQQNGVSERFNRTLQEGARTLLGRAGLPDPFWVSALRQLKWSSSSSSMSLHLEFHTRLSDLGGMCALR